MRNSGGSKILGLGTEKLHENGVEGLSAAAVLFPGLNNISWTGVIKEHVSLHEGQEEKTMTLLALGFVRKTF